MNTAFAVSLDGVRIAYDINGNGAPIVLLHGGLQNRQVWHDAGYVERLKNEFQVITIDIRGNGESDKPRDPADYTIDKHCGDILAVADASGLERFSIWGYSYGGNIGRYLAARSSHVKSFVMIGIPFGPPASEDFRKWIINSRDHWLPILQAQAAGTLDVQSLSSEDQAILILRSGADLSVSIASSTAMLDWGSVEPGDVLCPTLWLVGSRNYSTMPFILEYEAMLKGSKVQVHVMEGLDHVQELTEIEKVLPIMRAFQYESADPKSKKQMQKAERP